LYSLVTLVGRYDNHYLMHRVEYFEGTKSIFKDNVFVRFYSIMRSFLVLILYNLVRGAESYCVVLKKKKKIVQTL
jgi:hypothetical protein